MALAAADSTTITAAEVRYRLNWSTADITDARLASASFIPYVTAWESRLLADNSKTIITMQDYEAAILKAAKIAKCAMKAILDAPEEEVQEGPVKLKPVSSDDKVKLAKELQAEINDCLDSLEMFENKGLFHISGTGGDDYHPSGTDETQIDYIYTVTEPFRTFP